MQNIWLNKARWVDSYKKSGIYPFLLHSTLTSVNIFRSVCVIVCLTTFQFQFQFVYSFARIALYPRRHSTNTCIPMAILLIYSTNNRVSFWFESIGLRCESGFCPFSRRFTYSSRTFIQVTHSPFTFYSTSTNTQTFHEMSNKTNTEEPTTLLFIHSRMAQPLENFIMFTHNFIIWVVITSHAILMIRLRYVYMCVCVWV